MSDFSIQRGTVTIASSAASATITAGTDYTAPAALSKAFIRITGVNFTSDGISANFAGQPDNWSAWITNPSNLLTSITFSRGTAYADTTRISWEIIEYTGVASGAYEIIVRHQELLNFLGVDTIKDSSTVSGVVTAGDVVVFNTSQACDDTGSARGDIEQLLHTTEFISGSTVARVTRDDSGRTSKCSIAVVEFTGSAWSIQRITHSYTAADTAETETITTLGSVSQAFIHAQLRAYVAGASQPEYGGQTVYISSTSQLTFWVTDIDTTADAVVWLVEDTLGAMSVEQINNTRAAGAGTEPDSWTETISAVTLVTASIMGECGYTPTSGSANDSYDVTVGFELAGTTTATLRRAENQRERVYRFQVVQWPSASGGTPLSKTATLKMESVASKSTTKVLLQEGVKTGSLTTAINIEATGTIEIIATSIVLQESIQNQLNTPVIPVEGITSYQLTKALSIGSRQQLSQTISLKIESITGITRTDIMEFEAMANVSLSSTLNIESLTSISGTAELDMEVLASLASALQVPIEAIRGAGLNIIFNVAEKTAVFTVSLDRQAMFTKTINKSVTFH